MNLYAIKKLPAVYRTLSTARRVSGRAWMRLQNRVHGVQPRRVFFSSFKGKAYSDSPRFISEALHELRPDLEIVWQLSNPADAPDYVRAVKPHSLRALTELATARCIVDNFNRPIHLLKFPGQLYVQTWHGDRGFKKMLYDMNDGLAYPDGAQMDLAVSGSRFGTKNFRTAFRYDGEVLQQGMPRNDRLVHPDPAEIARIRQRLNIPENTRVLLYAPTFRDATSGSDLKAGFDLTRAIARLSRATNQKWLCLTRAHDQNRKITTDASDVRDMTDYPEMSDLLLIADMLITDYSSSAGDYVLLHRPVVLYQPDLSSFVQSDRDMYFDMKTCPYVRAESESALYSLLDRPEALIPSCQQVLDFYGATETGRSTEQVAQWISDRIPQ